MPSPLLALSAACALLAPLAALCAPAIAPAKDAPGVSPCISGIYPHLATFNDERECGTGAVVPWADRLWAISYGPHAPFGSSDKLYEITPELRQIVRPESVGGTSANRMIHRESGQLFLGPYAIDGRGTVRVIPPARMPGRLTGTARHLTDPSHKLYFATMEEGLYEVDVRTLAVVGLIRDGNRARPGQTDEVHPARIDSLLPGCHGKGLYSGQDRLVYANNGERDPRTATDPTIPSGALADWRGSGDWRMVRRGQFTEVTGPGGIFGNASPDIDPLWSVGWDHRSLIVMVLDSGAWHTFRLPKASHCYDGSHGWNTEWPRIRDIAPPGAAAPDLLMTMHGMLWRFPAGFAASRTAGITPRSTCLKVVGDFCRWHDRIVFGCDDAARSEFLNKRALKGSVAPAGQSQSNLWFVDPTHLDGFGPPLGRGGPWLDDPVQADAPSDPFLFAGFDRRSLHLATGAPALITLETDRRGDGAWTVLRTIRTAPDGHAWTAFDPGETGAWVRLKSDRALARATAFFQFANADRRGSGAAPMFDGIARPGQETLSGGLLHARGSNLRTLRFGALTRAEGRVTEGCYTLDARLALRRDADAIEGLKWMRHNVAIPRGVFEIDAASVVIAEADGRRRRLPKGDPAFDRPGPLGPERVCREVCTERDLLNVGGTFYELPAENAGGMARVRPIATHNRRIHDYCSYRGLLVISGVAADAPRDNRHIVRSDDGRCALWLGAVDDLWQLGKPRGTGGPWRDTAVRADEPSDPYLIAGYDRKRLVLSHSEPRTIAFRVEADFCGTGAWAPVCELTVPPGAPFEHVFPDAFAAYWIRIVPGAACRATATFHYD